MRKGWTVGPVLDLDSSPYYNIRSPRILSWIFFLLDEGLLDRFMVEPPCTILSPAQRPTLRGYDVPRGYGLAELGPLRGLRALAPIFRAAILGVPGFFERPNRTKMKRLSKWLCLLLSGLLKAPLTRKNLSSSTGTRSSALFIGNAAKITGISRSKASGLKALQSTQMSWLRT